jgi:hypothetical protein
MKAALVVNGGLVDILGVKVEAVVRLIREVVITIFIAVIIYKVINMDLAFDFTKLSATDLVALMLAVFSVGLSAAFYFAATNSSSKFYDNMHKFTKDTSVILGQLTERLNSVDKGQAEVKTRFDKLYSNGNSVDPESETKNKEKEKEKEEKVTQSREDLKGVIESLFDKHKIDDKERIAFKKRLEQKELQLSDSLAQLSEFKSEQKTSILKRVKNHTTMRFRKQFKMGNFSFELIIEKLLKTSVVFTKYKEDLIELGFLDNADTPTLENLTDSGFTFFSEIYENLQQDDN